MWQWRDWIIESLNQDKGDVNSPDKEHPLTPAVPEALGNRRVEILPVTLPPEASHPALRTYVQEDLAKQANDDISKAEASLARAQAVRETALKRLASQPATAPAAISAAAPAVIAEPENGLCIDFAKEVKPILEMNCFSCHKSTNAKSGLLLETLESALEGGRRSGRLQ